jgi:hypothetical protein
MKAYNNKLLHCILIKSLTVSGTFPEQIFHSSVVVHSGPNPHQRSHQVQIHITCGRPKLPKTRPHLQPSLGTKIKEPQRTYASFRVVKYPKPSILSFGFIFKHPEQAVH